MLALVGSWLAPYALNLAKWFFISLVVLLIVFGLYKVIDKNGRLKQKVEDYDAAARSIKKRNEIGREMRRATDPELDRWL